MANEAPLAKLRRASFADNEFRTEGIEMKGGLRKHTHEYPHKAGGQLEKLGRKSYIATINAVFLADDDAYPLAFPGISGSLVSLFEQQVTADLCVPTIGVFKATCIDWEQIQTPKLLNGVRMKLVFEETQETDQLADPLVLNYTSVGQRAGTLELLAIEDGFDLDLIAAILDLARQVDSLKDQLDLQLELLSRKVKQLTRAIKIFESAEPSLNDPKMWRVLYALQDLGMAALNVQLDMLRRVAPTGVFVLPRTMTAGEVSIAIYKDTSRTMEILRLNAIENPFVIPEGTKITYYLIPTAEQLAA